MSSRYSRALMVAVFGLLLTSCTSGTHRAGSPMTGGTGSTSTGSSMMGGGADYHYSRLTCAAPDSLPGSTVNVTLADMGMTQRMGGIAPTSAHMMLRAAPATAPAGQISLVASNMGWRTHELVLLPLADGATAGQRVPGTDGKVDEADSLGEASNTCAAGTGDGITPGGVGWTTVTLKPGRYELLCNLANHYADGMYQELIVT
jgi:uncharacterized cupredoxin-like copper-binding protein